MDTSTAAKIIANIEIKAKSYSSYVVVVASALAAYWMGLSPADREAWIAGHPVLSPLAPYLTLLAWAVAGVLPQYIKTHAQRQQERFDGFVATIAQAQAAGTLPPTASLLPLPAGIDPKALIAALQQGVAVKVAPAPPPPMPASAVMNGPGPIGVVVP